MKRNITIAAITAAVLIGGGTYTAFATGDDHGGSRPATRVSSQVTPSATHDSNDDHGGERTASSAPTTKATKPPTAAAGTHLDAREAAAAALKRYPGTLSSVEREDKNRFEVKVIGADHIRRELHVNATTGQVTLDDHGGGRHGDDDQGRDDH